MAEGPNIDIVDLTESKKYFCYQCTSEIVPELPDFTCSQCHSGFVEEMTESAIAAQRAAQRRSSVGDVPEAESYSRSLRFHDPEQRLRRRSGRFEGLFPERVRDASRDEHALPLHSFIDSILYALRENPEEPTRFRRRNDGVSQVYQRLASNFGNLDDIISRLVNQLSNSGPEPASPAQIENLPLTTVEAEAVVDEVQCSVCLERFEPGDMVSTLPCSHFYHNPCIVQWLQMHATCPVCRQALPHDASSAAADGTTRPTVSTPAAGVPTHESVQETRQEVATFSDLIDSTATSEEEDDSEMDVRINDDYLFEVYDDNGGSVTEFRLRFGESDDGNDHDNNNNDDVVVVGDDDDDDAMVTAPAGPPSSSLHPVYVDEVEAEAMDF